MGDKQRISVSVDVDSGLLSHVQAFANREGIPLQCLVVLLVAGGLRFAARDVG